MNIESIKINIAKQLFNINNEALLSKIQSILDKEAIVAYTTSGEPLTKEAYIQNVKEAEQQIEKGEYSTQEELLNKIKQW